MQCGLMEAARVCLCDCVGVAGLIVCTVRVSFILGVVAAAVTQKECSLACPCLTAFTLVALFCSATPHYQGLCDLECVSLYVAAVVHSARV